MSERLGEIGSEFASVEVRVDEAANGPRLRVEDLRTGQVGFLDALELETLAWLPAGGLHRLLDPSLVRWREQAAGSVPIVDLVRRLYAALAAGDRNGVEGLLDPGFRGSLTAGLPLGIGGKREGAEEMIERGWWAIGRAFELRAEPAEWISCDGGRLLVLGRYRGRARSTGRELEAGFAHLWSAREGRLAALVQLTDSAAWAAALEPVAE